MTVKPLFHTVLFDLDHTLIDTSLQYTAGLPEVLRQLYGHQIPDHWMEEFFRHHELLWKEFDARRITIDQLRRERFLRTWHAFERQPKAEEVEQFQRLLDKALDEYTRPLPEAEELLAQVSKEFPLAILSNGSSDVVRRKLKLAGLESYFHPEAVFVSEEIGPAKPDPLIYRQVSLRLGSPVERLLMIGDNYGGDVIGARKAGLQAIWYVPKSEGIRLSDGLNAGEPMLTTAKEVWQTIQKLQEVR
ncbi:HAD family hydrolase [Alicyclobacillus tolerans]|uniref:HAD superfamily hydrolase (TIGR01549 family) n=2 Tax=Alicyclobacillus tolerans TaxID=90970 RepID=A0ABT9LXS6_9BACL|nr:MULTISPECIES: HAD family hydrolase [Alicyclobacillus]MDP9729070.1 HAD superfamily hydrolase (TIGR01549 family) [Alicyclobacillus tengchongensis]SHK90458.1 2-haloacid dehalogenase/putative hydrolase of the HAD superfamily [Alicyclobacillus montanus]